MKGRVGRVARIGPRRFGGAVVDLRHWAKSAGPLGLRLRHNELGELGRCEAHVRVDQRR
jgi:hypothetical protein